MRKVLTTEEFIKRSVKPIHHLRRGWVVHLESKKDLWNYKKEHMKNVIKKLLNI